MIKTKHVIVAGSVTVAGVSVAIALAEQISPEDYHTEPLEALLDAGLYGGAQAVAALPALKPFLYISEPEEGSGFFLYVLIPVPERTAVGTPVITPTGGTLRVTYSAQSDDPRGPTAGLFHQTLIRVAAGVDTVIVECAMAGGGTGTSTAGTGDADHEDPIAGGPATPYMSGVSTDGLMLYTGGADCVVTVTHASTGVTTTTVRADHAFMRYDPGTPGFTLFTAGQRKVKGVW